MAGSIHNDPTDSTGLTTDSLSMPRTNRTHPDRIGPYRVLEELGEGGMGVVYLAELTSPIHRRAALKVIKLGMDTKQVMARFEAEREALALMNHPNVAQVFEAGATEEGRPYFAMEYVPGDSITQYCDNHRLRTDERLRLFIDACHGVHHAHQKGIIHRDLKPSNVLVSVQGDEAAVKIIDFGVAKATRQRLTDLTLYTEHGQLLGTPGYMSPEQASTKPSDVDTRTDIYSLGVVLYELLVGSRPFDEWGLRSATPEEVQRVICTVDPPKPSTRFSSLGADSTTVAQNRRTEPRRLVREIRGDLDWIVMKCLEKERTRRYASANELALDIERHLNNEPVDAGPPTIVYRAQKFWQRRRTGVMVAVVLLAAGGVFGYRQLQARQAAIGVLQASRLAQQCKSLQLAKKFPAAWEKCQAALTLDPTNSLALCTQGYLLLHERGDFAGALASYNHGLAPFEEFRLLPEDFHNRARLYRDLGDYKRALSDHNRAIALAPDEPSTYASRAVTLYCMGQIDAAIEDLRSATRIDRGWVFQSSLWLWEMRTLRGAPGDREAAAAALDAAQNTPDTDLEDRVYLDICRGSLSAEEALTRCETDEQRSYGYYFLGAKALADGRSADAADWFRKCVAAGAHQTAEFDLARWHLNRLDPASAQSAADAAQP